LLLSPRKDLTLGANRVSNVSMVNSRGSEERMVVTSIAADIAALRSMTTGELKRKYIEVFGEASRSNNKEFLWKRIAWRLQELAEGGLSERARKRAEELADEADIRIRPPKGAFAAAAALPHQRSPEQPTRRDPRLPIPGTVITKRYHHREISVVVLEQGFDYQGRFYRSLSAIAREVTGSHWNGFLFFGLTDKRHKS
jgi:hypothetical protein